jgi:hypothetical protein
MMKCVRRICTVRLGLCAMAIASVVGCEASPASTPKPSVGVPSTAGQAPKDAPKNVRVGGANVSPQ